MDLSVVIVNWNTKEQLRSCLTSIYKYSPEETPEILVVDNGSSDGSEDMLKKEFPAVKLIENRENLGFAKAVNRGVSLSSSKNILLLNPDCKLTKDSITNLLAVLEEYPKVGVVGAKLLSGDGSFQRGAAGSLPTPWTIFTTATLLYKLFPRWFRGLWLGRNETRPALVDWVSGACMLVRRKVFEQIGGLDERFFLLLEDVDFCRRASKASWQILYQPESIVFHQEGSSFEKQDKNLLLQKKVGLYSYLKRDHGGLALFISLLFLKINYWAKRGIFSLVFALRPTPANRKRLLTTEKRFRLLF